MFGRNSKGTFKYKLYLVNISPSCYRVYTYDKMLYLHYFDDVFWTNDL
jgi:hypothetical protein